MPFWTPSYLQATPTEFSNPESFFNIKRLRKFVLKD